VGGQENILGVSEDRPWQVSFRYGDVYLRSPVIGRASLGFMERGLAGE